MEGSILRLGIGCVCVCVRWYEYFSGSGSCHNCKEAFASVGCKLNQFPVRHSVAGSTPCSRRTWRRLICFIFATVSRRLHSESITQFSSVRGTRSVSINLPSRCSTFSTSLYCRSSSSEARRNCLILDKPSYFIVEYLSQSLPTSRKR